MRITLFALAALIAGLAGDVRPSAARPWYPWCAQYADRSGATSCAFTSFEQCLASVRGIGGSCVQNWHPAPAEPHYVPHRRHHAD
ncbi:MAG TPA: DUF3551 domain-containing protein [Xanthobacteraceae bacterium]|jgi:hypothetical protein